MTAIMVAEASSGDCNDGGIGRRRRQQLAAQAVATQGGGGSGEAPQGGAALERRRREMRGRRRLKASRGLRGRLFMEEDGAVACGRGQRRPGRARRARRRGGGLGRRAGGELLPESEAAVRARGPAG